MKLPAATALFLFSIVVFSVTVKAHAADLPNQNSPKTALKGPTTNTKNEFEQIVDFIMRKGVDARYGQYLAPQLGFPGAMPIKGKNIRSKKIYRERGGLNCEVAYEESSEATEYAGKRPLHIFLVQSKLSGQDTESRYYMLSLTGQLEKVILMRGKNDDTGKPIRGSAVDTTEDINSPTVKKGFEAEMADLRQWLKQQQALAKKTASNTAEPTHTAP